MKNSVTLLLSVLAGHTHKGKLPSFTLIGVCTRNEAHAKCDNCKMRFNAL